MLVEQRRNSTQFAVKSPTWRISMWVGFFNLLFLPAQHYMLVQELAVALCLSVCVCHKSVLSKQLNESSWVSHSFLPPILHCIERTFKYLQKLWYFPLELLSQTSDFRKFASAYRSSKRVIDLGRQDGHSSTRDILDRRQSAKLTVPPSSDSRPLVYHSNHQALSAA